MVGRAYIWYAAKDKVLMKKYAPNELLVRQGANEDTYIYVVNGWDIAFEVCGQRATIFFDNIKLTATEFDEVRRIILYQNIYNYDDTPMSEDVRRVVEQYYTLKNKGIIPPSLQRRGRWCCRTLRKHTKAYKICLIGNLRSFSIRL